MRTLQALPCPATNGTCQQALDEGWISYRPDVDVARFADGGFATPSGKVEFWCDRARAAGFDALPDYIEPAEDTRSPLAGKFPLAMISPPARNFLNSTFVNVDSLRATEGQPWLDMHPHDALSRHIADGASVRVFNQRGSIELTCRVTGPGAPRRGGGPLDLVEKARQRRQERQRIDQSDRHRHGQWPDLLRLSGPG